MLTLTLYLDSQSMYIPSLIPTTIKSNFQLLSWGVGLTQKPEGALEAQSQITTAIRTSLMVGPLFIALAFPQFSALIFIATALISFPISAAASCTKVALDCIPALAAQVFANSPSAVVFNLFHIVIHLTIADFYLGYDNQFFNKLFHELDKYGLGYLSLLEPMIDILSAKAANSFYPEIDPLWQRFWAKQP